MRKIFLIVSVLGMTLMFGSCKKSAESEFIYVKDGQFMMNEKPYYFVGTNFCHGAILASEGEGGNRERLIKELDFMQSIGINNLRILVGSDGDRGIQAKVEPTLQTAPGVYNDTILAGLDYLMMELGNRKMYAVLYLNNSWEWSGGYSMYLQWAGFGKAPVPAVDGWDTYMKFVRQFHQSDSAKALFANYVKDIVIRENRFTKKKYIDDPAIMSWQIGNEPRAFSDKNKEPFEKWMIEVAGLIKSLDPNHMVSSGSEGSWGCENDLDLFERIHADKNFDYLNIHLWPYNWSWVKADSLMENLPRARENTKKYINEHLELGRKLRKPVVMEEFGFPRDGFKFSKETTTKARDSYYKFVFDMIKEDAAQKGIFAGCNFWGWGGFAKLPTDHVYWQKNDDYTGDPAQEQQGLNSVYATDQSTIELIKTTNSILSSIK